MCEMYFGLPARDLLWQCQNSVDKITIESTTFAWSFVVECVSVCVCMFVFEIRQQNFRTPFRAL